MGKMTSDNNNRVGGENGEIVSEMRMLFVEVKKKKKSEEGASVLLFKVSFGADLLLVATGSQT